MRVSTITSVASILFIAVISSVYSQRISTIQLEGVQYFISKMNPYSPALNYFLAYQYCRSLGLQLTSFETKEKADGIAKYLQNAGYSKYDFWTSGNRLGTDMFLWMSTGLPFNATFDYMTKPGEIDETNPTETEAEAEEARSDDGASNGCVVLKAPDHKWHTDDCTEVKDFICEQTRCYYYNYGSIPVSTAQGPNKDKTTPVKLPPTTEVPPSTTEAAATPEATPPFTVETTLPPLLNFTVQRRSSLRPHLSPAQAHAHITSTREKTGLNEFPSRSRDSVDVNRHIPRNFAAKNTDANVVYVKAVGVKDGETGWSLAYVDKHNATLQEETTKLPEPTKPTVFTRNFPDANAKKTIGPQ